MARLRQTEPESVTTPAIPPSSHARNPNKNANRGSRKAINLENATIDLHGYSAGQLAKLRNALDQAQPGFEARPVFTGPLKPEPPPEPPAKVDPALVGMLINAIAQLEGLMMGRKFGLPADKAIEIATPKEPLAGMLNESAARICDKYNLMGRYADEVALMSLLMVWQAGVLNGMKAAAAELKTTPINEKRNSMGTEASGKEYAGAGSRTV